MIYPTGASNLHKLLPPLYPGILIQKVPKKEIYIKLSPCINTYTYQHVPG